MTRKCFYVHEVNSSDEYVTLNKDVTRHVEDVLRLKAGDPIELRDGQGNAWMAVIAGSERGIVRVRIKERQQVENESPMELTLAMALSRSDRLELVFRQATEIGAHRLVAFRARRSQYGLAGHLVGKRKERWSRIVREAMCQCGRKKLPEISILEDVDELLLQAERWGADENTSLKVLACEAEESRNLLELKKTFPDCGHVMAVVGTEGGWTDDEIEKFTGSGYHSVHLGPRILRLETAAIAMISSVQLLWGDMGGLRCKGVERNEMP